MNQLTPVVKQLLIINVIIYGVAYYVMPSLKDLLPLYYPTFTEQFQPFQLVTSMFMHFGPMHLFLNMFILFQFGPPVESMLGSKKFLLFYMLCGFGATGLHLGMTALGVISPSVVAGASGAIYGVMAGFAFFFPNTQLMLLIPPIPMKAKYLIGGFIALDLFFGVTGFQTGIANFAHLGGALTAFALLFFWKKTDQSFRIN